MPEKQTQRSAILRRETDRILERALAQISKANVHPAHVDYMSKAQIERMANNALRKLEEGGK